MPRASTVLASVAAAALLATIGSPAHADVYSNESTADSYLIGLSTGGAATLSGEVFTAPGGTLDSWTFSVANGTDSPPGNVQFVIAPWTGNPTTNNETFTIGGPALYTSAAVTAGGVYGVFSDLTFSGIDVALTEGTTYIAYLTINGVSSPATLLGMRTSATSGPIGDGWTETNPDINYYYTNFQLTYSATFVPEPGSMALLATGLIGLGLLRRRHG